jgi:uroporphyrinogen-III decarboxylase
VDDATLKVEDNLEEFVPIAERDLNYLRERAERLYTTTDKAILLNPGGTSFGSFSATTAPALKHPKGIRSVEEWQMSTITRRDHLVKIFERQLEIGLANLQKIADAVGNRVTAVITSYTDFGAQNGPFISPQTYRDLYKPFNKAVNDWVHQHTTWKTFTHCCGSVRALLRDFVEAGFDILNPVQTSAAHMDPVELKKSFGDVFTFWGGGIDTQRTLPFGTPQQVREEVRQRLKVFGMGGGFVFNPVHNVQARAPIENIVAMYETVREFGNYPLS